MLDSTDNGSYYITLHRANIRKYSQGLKLKRDLIAQCIGRHKHK